MHAGHAQVERVVLRERAERHQGGHHRDARSLHELRQLLVRVGLDHTAADVEHRALRLRDHLRRLRDLAVVRLRVRLVPRQVHLRRPGKLDLRVLHVLRDVHQHRAGAAGRRDMEGRGDRAGDFLRLGHHQVVLGYRHGDAADVRFLERVGAQKRRADLPGDSHHRHRIQVGVRDRGDQVGRARAGGGDAHAHVAGGHRVAFRGMSCALFVAHQHVAQFLGAKQRVVKREHCTTGQTEYDLGAQFLEAAHDCVRTRHAFGLSFLCSCHVKAPCLLDSACYRDLIQQKPPASDVLSRALGVCERRVKRTRYGKRRRERIITSRSLITIQNCSVPDNNSWVFIQVFKLRAIAYRRTKGDYHPQL